MDGDGRSYGGHAADLLGAVIADASTLVGNVWRLSESEIDELIGLSDRCRAVMEASVFTLLREAESRGLVAASQAGSSGGWLAARAEHLDERGAGAVAKAVRRLAPERFAGARDAVAAGRVSPGVGSVVVEEFTALEGLLQPGAEQAVLDGLVTIGRVEGARGVRRLRGALLERYGLGDEVQDEQDRRAGGTGLSRGRCLGGGLNEYRLRLTDPDAAVLEAALNPLTRPTPPPDAGCGDGGMPDTDVAMGGGADGQGGGSAAGAAFGVGGGAAFGVGGGGAGGTDPEDRRTFEQRRGGALVEVCRRATAAASGLGSAAGLKACVIVTIDYDDLRERTAGWVTRSAGSAAGSPTTGGSATHQSTTDRPTTGGWATRSAGSADIGSTTGGLTTGQPTPEGPAADQPAADSPDAGAPARGSAVPGPPAGAFAGGSAAGGPVVEEALPAGETWAGRRGGRGVGVTIGGLDAGTLLGPQTVRRMACDAGILPVVLGARGEILDVGRVERLFTPAQVRALWLRDRHCTFPGCRIPATWCDAHHLTHWADGGPTDLGNAALLCGRHHTIVHRDRLVGTVTADGVVWDRAPGSYDRHLTHLRQRHGPHSSDDDTGPDEAA